MTTIEEMLKMIDIEYKKIGKLKAKDEEAFQRAAKAYIKVLKKR